jgi:hypothetical protein
MKKTADFKQFYALLKQMPNTDKEELVWQHSNMMTTSLREFYDKSPNGYTAMIVAMQNAIGHNEAEVTRLRSAILHRLQKGGIDTADWATVNAYLRDKRIAGKPLYKLTIPEMNKLIKKLEVLLEKFRIRQEMLKKIQAQN